MKSRCVHTGTLVDSWPSTMGQAIHDQRCKWHPFSFCTIASFLAGSQHAPAKAPVIQTGQQGREYKWSLGFPETPTRVDYQSQDCNCLLNQAQVDCYRANCLSVIFANQHAIKCMGWCLEFCSRLAHSLDPAQHAQPPRYHSQE